MFSNNLKTIFILLLILLDSVCFAYAYKRVDIQIGGDLSGLDKKHRKKVTFEKAEIKFNTLTVGSKIKTRGQNCLSSARKCFSVTLNNQIDGLPTKFKLASLSQDHAYINYVIGLLFMDEIGLNHLKSEYIHLNINQQSNGLYLLIEDPKTVLKEQMNAVFIGRRKVWPMSPETKYYSESSPFSEKEYQSAFSKIAKKAKKIKGEDKHDFLKLNMNIDSYFDWLAVNTLLQNSDYDDELFFYATERKDGRIYFDFMGWDYEDLFAKPHFVNKIRRPFSIKKTILHSLVQKIDYVIYKDKYEYQKFLVHMKTLIKNRFESQKIKQIFSNVQKKIKPFLSPAVLKASSLDKQKNTPYTKVYIENILQVRLQQVLTRANYLLRYKIPT